MTWPEGRLVVQGDRAVLTFERRLPYPVEAVWSAIADPGERAEWFGETSIDARVGGQIDMVATGPPLPVEKKRMTGRILVWDPPRVLDAADAIVFGSATYMGNVSSAFQAFAEQTGRRCMNGTWRDKVAAGFTNSGGKAGDKMHTLTSLAVFAAQHHMHWLNLGLGAGWNSSAGSEDDLNRLSFFLGAGAQTDVDADPDQVHPSDVATCRHLGRRVALVTRQLNLGRAASSPAASSAPAR